MFRLMTKSRSRRTTPFSVLVGSVEGQPHARLAGGV